MVFKCSAYEAVVSFLIHCVLVQTKPKAGGIIWVKRFQFQAMKLFLNGCNAKKGIRTSGKLLGCQCAPVSDYFRTASSSCETISVGREYLSCDDVQAVCAGEGEHVGYKMMKEHPSQRR